MTDFFPDFEPIAVDAGGVRFGGVMGGEGPPVLLLHGYPETHVAWRHVAPALASGRRVVVPDLPGYGDSWTKDIVGDGGARWTKRRVGAALHEMMVALGHPRYAVVGHDRGARVGYRMALDRPDAVRAFASIAVVPTLDAMEAIDYRAAAARFHWFFLSQPAPLPKRLLAADPGLFLDRALDGMTGDRLFLEEEARRAYHDAFAQASVRHAMCEDYRAALDEDLAADCADRAAGVRLACPVLVLWPGTPDRQDAESPTAIWRRWADDVAGGALPGGHLLPEECPQEVLLNIRRFFTDRET